MYLDLHSHSVSSDDSRATVEQYVKWVQMLRSKRGCPIDGFVLSEHRKFDFDKDYSQLATEYDVTIMKASELDTRHGHVLVYGVTEGLANDIDLGDVKMDARELIKAARHHGGIAVPAHPGRFGVGLVEYMEQGETFPDLTIVERINGGSRPPENERADNLCREYNYLGTGGSDAHLASHLGTCMTYFPTAVRDEWQLVDALLTGDFTPVWMKDIQKHD
jgi:predicted metal-dependent phosphoesterase TrpH